MTMTTALDLGRELPELGLLAQPVRQELMQRITAGELDLPMLPTIVLEVLALTRADDVDASKLSRLLHRDPTLASNLLRVANSALYRPTSPIVSLQQAIARLGLNAITEIVLAATVGKTLFRAPGFDEMIGELWYHSSLAAAFAKEIARMRRRSVEAAFLCGLLHDIGRPAAIATLVELSRKHRVELEPAVVLSVCDIVHQAIGVQLGGMWKLPDTVVMSIGHHHDPATAPAHADAVLMTVLADRFAHAAAREPFDPTTIDCSDHAASLNLYPDDIETLIAFRDQAVAFAAVLR